MRAADTNVVVCLLTGDHAGQTRRAAALFRSEDVWLPKTVILETEWVLRSLYRFTGGQISSALRALAGLPNVQMEDAPAVAQALEWSEAGLEFPDALHLASAGSGRDFVTFDAKLVKRAKRLNVGNVALLR